MVAFPAFGNGDHYRPLSYNRNRYGKGFQHGAGTGQALQERQSRYDGIQTGILDKAADDVTW